MIHIYLLRYFWLFPIFIILQENLEVEKGEYSKRFKKKIPEIEKIAEAKREKIEKQKEKGTNKLKRMSEKLSANPNAYPPGTKTCGCF